MRTNWFKRSLIAIILLLSSVLCLAQGTDCELRWDRFSNDVNGTTAASRALVSAIDENSDIITSWWIMDEVGETALRTNVEELKYLSSHLKEFKKQPESVVEGIKNAGGFTKWKVAKAGGDFLSTLGRSGFSKLKKSFDELDDVLKAEFKADFGGVSDNVLKKLQDENLFDAWKNNVRSTDLDALKNSIANGNLRSEYDGLVSALSREKIKLLEQGKTMEEVARALQAERRRLTIYYKHITPDDFLEWIFKRNDMTYTRTGRGDKWGATFEGLLTSKANKKRIDLNTATQSQLNEIYESIADGASRTSGATKQQLGDNFYDFFKDKISSSELVNFETILKKYRMR